MLRFARPEPRTRVAESHGALTNHVVGDGSVRVGKASLKVALKPTSIGQGGGSGRKLTRGRHVHLKRR